MLKKVNIIGIPLWLYLIIGVLLMTAVYTNSLPNEFIGTFAMCVYWGSLLMWAGSKIPIVNSYMGGQVLLPLVVCSLMSMYKIVPESTVGTIKSLMSGGFQNLYIAALITGSIISMDRKTLLKAVAKYMPCIIVSQICVIAAVAGATLLVRKDLFEGLLMVGLPCMAGGSGSAMTTLPTMYASMLGLDFETVSSSLMAVLMVANILAIVFSALLSKLGDRKTEWTGHGNILMADKDDTIEADKQKTSTPLDISSFGSGLLMTCMIYIIGNIIGHIPGFSKIHMLAWTIIVACVIKATGVLPEKVETSCTNYYNYMMKNLLCVVCAGIGFSSFNMASAASVLSNPANLFIVVVAIIAATVSAMIVGRLMELYPVETGISVGLCSCCIGGSGDLAVLMAADRMNLLPFASISTRIGGALMLVWISLLMPMFI